MNLLVFETLGDRGVVSGAECVWRDGKSQSAGRLQAACATDVEVAVLDELLDGGVEGAFAGRDTAAADEAEVGGVLWEEEIECFSAD